MGRVLLLIFCCLLTNTCFAQPSEIIDETWYLKYIEMGSEKDYIPLEETFSFSFFFDGTQLMIQAVGVVNELTAQANFNGDQLELSQVSVTSLDCSMPNCSFEELFFYDLLSTLSLTDKTFFFENNYFFYPGDYLQIEDSGGRIGYFINNGATPEPELFQTWYLYQTGVDLEPPKNHYGPDVPRLIVYPDLTFEVFAGTNISEGRFIYFEDNFNDSYLFVQDLEDEFTGILEISSNIDFPLYSFFGQSDLWLESFPGFYSSLRNTITLDVVEQDVEVLKIYPNPVLNMLYISTQHEIDAVVIYDVTGKQLLNFSENGNQYNVSTLASGVYFLSIQSEGKSITKKIIKQ